MPRIPQVDVRAQYAPLIPELERAFARVLDSGRFIFGPEVTGFEQEAAEYLGLEIDTVYKKSRLRELPSVKVGRALRFDVKALERFIEQHTIETIDD